MTHHIEEPSGPARPTLSGFATRTTKRRVSVETPPEYEKAMAAIRPVARWVRVLAFLALAGGPWLLAVSWLMLK
jgi:hypothetical protein